MDRLDKFVADNSTLSRADAKTAIKNGRVKINGVIQKDAGTKVKETDTVELDNKGLKAVGLVYIMLNKPQGVLSATEDGRTKTVLDLVKENEDIKTAINKTELFPIGRLDKDTEGLLILTNDGETSHFLLSPKRHVPKVYYAECDGCLTEDAVQSFAEGIMVGEDYKALPAELEIIEKTNEKCKLQITLSEGKFHQVKRMCHEVGVEVTFLKRIRFAGIPLDEKLAPGEMRFLTENEIGQLVTR